MQWIKNKSTYTAQGELGKFVVQKSRNVYFAKYISADKSFNLPPSQSLKEIKETCESNFYWED